MTNGKRKLSCIYNSAHVHACVKMFYIQLVCIISNVQVKNNLITLFNMNKIYMCENIVTGQVKDNEVKDKIED